MVPDVKYILTLFLTLSCTVTEARSLSYYIQHFNNENGLVQNSIKGIEIDKQGYLWLGTEMGLVRYDGSNFKLYDKLNSPELGTDRILNMGLLKDGNVFVAFEDYGFYYINSRGVLQHIPKNHQEKNILSDYFSISKIYTIYNKCRLKYKNGQIPKWAIPDYDLISGSLSNSLVYTNKQYYYFNENRELITADTNLTTFCKVSLQGQLSLIPGNNTNTKAGAVALMARNNTLYVRWRDYIYKLSFLKPDHAVGEQVLHVGDITNITYFLEVPGSNMFVVGTSSDGFYIFQKHLFSVLTLKDPEPNVFYAQAPYSYNGVLTNKGVLFPDKHIPPPSDGFTYESILMTTDGKYYLGRIQDEFESGVVELNSQLQELRYIRGNNVHVNCFRQLKDGSVWLSLKGNVFGKIENNQIKWMDFQKSLPPGFRVNTFIVSSKNELWIAGYHGLVRIHLATGTTYLVPELTNAEVRSLYEDNKGTIWIGTYGNGYYALYKEKCISMPMDDAHFLATAHTFMEDNSGRVWITTNRGLFQAQMADLYDYLDAKSSSVYYYYFDKTAGFLTNEFNGGCTPSGIRLNNGMFSFPSVKGLVQFYPDSIKSMFPDAQIYIDAIIGDTTTFSNDNKPLIIPSKINRLHFYISSPYFGNSYNQSIEYKLENNGVVWYKMNKSGIIQFSKLPSGNHRLLLRKKAGFGKDHYITKVFSFSVTPPFYKTWLFKMLLLASLAAIIYSFFRFRMLYLLQLKDKLEKEVLNKTKEQTMLIDNLETTVLELKQKEQELFQNNLFKEELAMIVAHDLQSPLRFISSTTKRIYNTLLNNELYEAQALTLDLSRSSHTTYRFVEDFTLWLSTLGTNFQLHNTRVNLHKLVNELRHFFSEMLLVRNNKLKIDVDELLEISTDGQLLKIVLRNIIDNANKHTNGGIIHISGKAIHSAAFIIISDNGKGMKEEVLKKIQCQVKSGLSNIKNNGTVHGHGYRFICQFCSLLNIDIEVDSKWGEGTVVTLSDLTID